MFYAIRETAHSTMLIEIKSRKEEDELRAAGYHIRRVTAQEAHRMVKADCIHETGLYVEDGKVKHAPADPGC